MMLVTIDMGWKSFYNAYYNVQNGEATVQNCYQGSKYLMAMAVMPLRMATVLHEN